MTARWIGRRRHAPRSAGKFASFSETELRPAPLLSTLCGTMPVAQLTILGSGSSGNCAYLEADNTRLLIDAGLSGRQIRQRLLSIGRTPENLAGILITHEHSDHIQGLVGLAAKLHLPVYCNRLTQEAIKAQLKLALDFRVFETGTAFAIEALEVETFSIPHDAYDPVGFLVRSSGGTFGFLTDWAMPPSWPSSGFAGQRALAGIQPRP